MRTTGCASPASLAGDPRPQPDVRVADAAYGCVDWFLYEDATLPKAAAAAEAARLAQLAAALLPSAADSPELRCA